MKIAIPITDSREFSEHYGAATALACFECDKITHTRRVESLLLPTGGSPCSWPEWLHYEGVNVVLVGGMGDGARARYAKLGIEVIAGVLAGVPSELAQAFLDGVLETGESACQHGDHGHAHEHDQHQHHDQHHAGHCQCSH